MHNPKLEDFAVEAIQSPGWAPSERVADADRVPPRGEAWIETCKSRCQLLISDLQTPLSGSYSSYDVVSYPPHHPSDPCPDGLCERDIALPIT